MAQYKIATWNTNGLIRHRQEVEAALPQTNILKAHFTERAGYEALRHKALSWCNME